MYDVSQTYDATRQVGESSDLALVDEGLRLKLAGRILLGIAILGIGASSFYGVYPDNLAASSIFELVKIGLLPLATLVVSFYFTREQK